MWFNGIAKWGGGLAHYDILQQKESVYQAILKKYDGRPGKMPPSDFLLTRGIKGWEGNINDQSVIDQLGVVIDNRVRGRLYNTIQRLDGKRF